MAKMGVLLLILTIGIGCDRNNGDEDAGKVADAHLDEILGSINKYGEGDFLAAKEVWGSTSADPVSYAQSAYVMLSYMESKREWMTLGSVVKLLGEPSFVSTVAYSFDEDNNVDTEVTRTQIGYEPRCVIVSFSVTGFVENVLYETSPNSRVGAGARSWPQEILDSDILPIISGTFDSTNVPHNLIVLANELIQKYEFESDWFALIAGWKHLGDSPAPKVWGRFFGVKIEIVDGITRRLARVHYKIDGKHVLYYDTWWLLDNGKWQVISPAEAETEILTGAGN